MNIEIPSEQILERIPRKLTATVIGVLIISHTATTPDIVDIKVRIAAMIVQGLVLAVGLYFHYKLELKNPTPDNGANPPKP